MAIDPRISLAAQVPSVTPAINIFENALNNAQTREMRQQQMAQADIMNPLRVQQAQQGVDINSQSIAAGEAQAQQANQLRILKSVNDFGVQNQSIIDNALTTGDAAPLQASLTQRLATLKQQGLPTQETEDALFMVGQGNIQGVADSIRGAQDVYNQRLTAKMPASQREFQYHMGVYNDPKANPVAKIASGIALGLESSLGTLSKDERLARKDELAKKIAENKAKEVTATTQAKVDVEMPAEEQKQTLTANVSRLKVLKEGEKASQATIRKAKRFKKAFTSGKESGATRSAWSIVPGVFTDQAGFDEQFNAFAEVAARQTLKASGETKPTDNDVEGMKRAMFGVGRDEATNIKLLEDYISSQEDVLDELDDLREAKKAGTLKTFVGQASVELSEADILAKYGL